MRRSISMVTVAALCGAGLWTALQAPAGASPGVTVQLAGISSPTAGEFTPSGSGDVTQSEFPGQLDEPEGPGPYPGGTPLVP